MVAEELLVLLLFKGVGELPSVAFAAVLFPIFHTSSCVVGPKKIQDSARHRAHIHMTRAVKNIDLLSERADMNGGPW